MELILALSIVVRWKAMPLVDAIAAVDSVDPVAREVDFLALWHRHCAKLPLIQMAAVGGALADRFAWIFAAGYQGAVRHCFPALEFSGWAAFAVSEDNRDQDALPGVAWANSAEFEEGVVVNGTKTWIAASAIASDLVFSAGKGGDRRFFRIARDHPGLVIETRAPGRVLPDLSQGSAHFYDVRLAATQEVDSRLVAGFGASEVLYIYTAFLASTWVRAEKERKEVEVLLSQAEAIAGREAISREDVDMVALDKGVQALLKHLREFVFGGVGLWRRDYKLVAMYGRH